MLGHGRRGGREGRGARRETEPVRLIRDEVWAGSASRVVEGRPWRMGERCLASEMKGGYKQERRRIGEKREVKWLIFWFNSNTFVV